MNIDITFPNAPCYLIDIDVASAIQVQHQETSRQELLKRRLTKGGELISKPEPSLGDAQSYVTELMQALVEGEQCHIKGKIHVYKVTGKVLFSFNSKLNIVELLRNQYPEQATLLKLTHVLKSLTYGDVAQHLHILFRFGATDHTKFDMVNMMDDNIYALDLDRRDYFYFMKLVPHIFIDEISDAEFRSYSYSLNHNSKQSMNDIGQIQMIYDFTPVNMKITKHKRDLPRFLVNLCAIVGGVFVIFGLLNRAMLAIKEAF